jgi:hypothetical protein
VSRDDDPETHADRDDPGTLADQLERETRELERHGEEVEEHIGQTEQEIRGRRADSDIGRSLRTEDEQSEAQDAEPEESQPEDAEPEQ